MDKNRQPIERLTEDRWDMIQRLGLKSLIEQMCEQAKIKWELSDKGFEGNITEEEKRVFEQANERYKELEKLLRQKFSEHQLSDYQTATIMDYIWTDGIGLN